MTLSGFSGTKTVSVSGAAGSRLVVDGADTGLASADVSSGATLAVIMPAFDQFEETRTAIVTLGNYSTDWSVTTRSDTLRSCKEILDAGLSTGSGMYTVDPDGFSGPLGPIEVWCDMVTDGGGWTIVVGASAYGSNLPFSPSLQGVNPSFSGGTYHAYQGTTPNGACHSPYPAYSAVVTVPHDQVKWRTWQRWHNATSSQYYVDFENDGVVEYKNSTCGSACGQGSVWSFNHDGTATSASTASKSRIRFAGTSCQNFGGTINGELIVYDIRVR